MSFAFNHPQSLNKCDTPPNEFVNVHLPHKKPRGKELTEAQKQENREFSRQRVVCEHAHAGIKRCRPVIDESCD
ncbi:transposase family protein [Pseudanabaena sp. SR411]|uniref:transposase family protein n=1 Tax=Pseudanabaena sp. SR411 TaxID=1980935 RepID=UPI0034E974EA